MIAGFLAEAEAAPEELSTIANVLPAPPLPLVPADHHGKLVVLATVAFAGDLEAGERVVAPLRALATPLADLVKPMPYPQIYPPEEEGFHPTAALRTLFIDAVDRDGTAAIVEHLQASTAPMRVVQLRVLGGAMARVPAEATAFAHRASRLMVNVTAIYGRPEEAEVHQAWADHPFTAIMNAARKVVFSRTLRTAEWANTTIAAGDTTQEIDKLRRGGDGHIVVWGGVSLWRSLMRLDLIDEFRLDLHPYVAGEGTRLFDDVPKSYRLDLVSSTAFSNGIVGLHYRRHR